MTIEEKIFSRKRFVYETMLESGFIKTDRGYRYSADFMNGDFSAELLVSDNGEVTGKVIDKMNGEEYRQLRFESFQGAFVNSVRSAYEELLGQIASKCCKDVLFPSDQANRIVEQIANRYGIGPDYPFEQSQYRSYGVFRHGDNKKWFALIMTVKRRVLLKNGDESSIDIINLKSDPEKSKKLILNTGVYPAYHMSHKYWISVLLDDSLRDEEVMELIDDSFRLTEKTVSKK